MKVEFLRDCRLEETRYLEGTQRRVQDFHPDTIKYLQDLGAIKLVDGPDSPETEEPKPKPPAKKK